MLTSGKPNLIRQFNRDLIRDLIQTKGPVTKNELARLSGASVPTVNKIVNQLEAEGIEDLVGLHVIDAHASIPPEMIARGLDAQLGLYGFSPGVSSSIRGVGPDGTDSGFFSQYSPQAIEIPPAVC